MPDSFAYLSSSIVRSTIWDESSDVRVLFITMLALKDKDGCVWASIPGLAHEARVPVSVVEKALQIFMSPDHYSRTSDEEGRRLEVIDGGWRFVNHGKYRRARDPEKRREQNREAQQRARDKRQSPSAESQPESARISPSVSVSVSGSVKELPCRAGAQRPRPKKPSRTDTACDDCQRLVEYFNREAGRQHPLTDRTGKPTAGVRLIHARHTEHSVDACQRVIDDRVGRWKGDAKMDEFLRLSTVFRKSHFESYLEDLRARGPSKSGKAGARAAEMREWDDKLGAMIDQVKSEKGAERAIKAVISEAGRRLREQGITPPASERFTG